MSQRMMWLVSLVALLVLSQSASAQIMWNDAGADSLWSTAENWSTSSVPTSLDAASIDQPPDTHCVVEEGIDAECETLRVGNGGVPTNLDITGGSLTAAGAYVGVDSPSGHGILNISGGRFATGSLQIGWRGTGTLNMTGGTVELSDNLVVPGLTGTGTVNLRGGTIYADELRLTSESGLVDVGAGTLILDGDDTETLQTFIDDGWLVAYEGQGILHVDYDVTNPGKTTVTATALLDPHPADGGLVSPGQVELSWTLPDPCVPGEPVLVDVYFTDDLEALESFADPEAIQIVSAENVSSVVVQAERKTRYYWAVDVYVGSDDDPIFGPIFTFLSDNLVPQVDAGADIVTWLEGEPRIGALDATVADDGAVMPYTVQWKVISEPNEADAVIETPTAEDTNVTLPALGEYVLQLAAFDGEYIGTDTVTINVYSDSCAAAQSLPDYVPLVGDLNGDCRVDDVDMALLEANWMLDSSLTEEWYEVD
ncbi:MAG: hypothetical protein JSW27_05280 [Phycisphaerales bacterium]|nr:MAG: hypothetical protein JSW27_05280 [Phycisphaerales bacterium]